MSDFNFDNTDATFTMTLGETYATGGVSSVNGQTGVVVLDAEDVGALPDTTEIPSKTSDLTNDSGFIDSSALTGYATQSYVQSYHDSTKADVSTTYTKTETDNLLSAKADQSTTYTKTEVDSAISTKQDVLTAGTRISITDNVVSTSASAVEVSASGTSTSDVQYITVNGTEYRLAGGSTGGVTSVNGQTGVVVLDAEDVGALPSSTVVPTKTSDLTNDSGFITNTVNNLTNYTLTSGLATVATSGSYTDLSNKPTIPETIITKVSAGTGINTDTISGEATIALSSEAQTSLGKADTAVQPAAISDMATQTWVGQQGYITSSYHDSTKQDVSTLETDVAAKGFTKNAGTITGINMNGASKGTSGVVDLGTVITEHQSLAAYRTSTAQDAIDTEMSNDIVAIEGKIPSAATSSNQLADKEFVNSSISTETAHYISNAGEPFTSVAQLEAYTGTVTNNDYAFVTGTDTAGNTYYDRYKATVSGSTVTWAKEYRLNNSSFTAAQWSAISSGITSSKVTSYDDHIANTTVHVTASDKTTWNAKQDAIPANTYDAYGSAATVQGNLDTHTSDTTIHVTSSEKSTWNGKQDAISDLATIRSGASAGATALQPNTAITGATKCKVTYDANGLVTAGADLSASDIPSLTVSKLSDITATATELNTLDGITATTSELNILDGVTATASELNTLDGITATTTELNYTDGVTSNIQTQLDGKASKPDMGTISLSATWTGSASPYSQTVTVSGATVTSNSKVDIQPDSTALAQMLSDGCNALYISNNNGTLTAYAIGSGTTTALTIQCTVTEVTA